MDRGQGEQVAMGIFGPDTPEDKARAAWDDVRKRNEELCAVMETLLAPHSGQRYEMTDGDSVFVWCSPDVLRRERIANGMDDQAAAFTIGQANGKKKSFAMGGFFTDSKGKRQWIADQYGAGHEFSCGPHYAPERILGLDGQKEAHEADKMFIFDE